MVTAVTMFSKAAKALNEFSIRAGQNNLESARIARSFVASITYLKDYFEDKTNIADFVTKMAHWSGGWCDPEETAWCISCLINTNEYSISVVEDACVWLRKTRHTEGGWGRHPRDQVRIPTTALVIALVPSVATDLDREWVRQAWEKDMTGPVRLSYKGGFYLLTVDCETSDVTDPLVTSTIAYLAGDQNEDGGFGPWKDHPIGSDPWSTGVVLWGLSKWIDRVDPKVIEKAFGWLEKTQLPSGYWPYHYLDEGTSYALIGAVSAMRAMESRK